MAGICLFPDITELLAAVRRALRCLQQWAAAQRTLAQPFLGGHGDKAWVLGFLFHMEASSVPFHIDRASDEASQHRALLAVFRSTMNGPRRMPDIPVREGQGVKGWGGGCLAHTWFFGRWGNL